jgi:hypothetical protein
VMARRRAQLTFERPDLSPHPPNRVPPLSYHAVPPEAN